MFYRTRWSGLRCVSQWFSEKYAKTLTGRVEDEGLGLVSQHPTVPGTDGSSVDSSGVLGSSRSIVWLDAKWFLIIFSLRRLYVYERLSANGLLIGEIWLTGSGNSFAPGIAEGQSARQFPSFDLSLATGFSSNTSRGVESEKVCTCFYSAVLVFWHYLYP